MNNEILVTCRLKLNKEDLNKIERRIQKKTVLTGFKTVQDYLQSRMKKAVVKELSRTNKVDEAIAFEIEQFSCIQY